MAPKNKREAGIALITVLLLLALLTLLATAVQALSVSYSRAVDRFSVAARDEALADSALRLVLFELSAPATQRSNVDWSASRRLELFHRAIDVTIEREAGRIDLNTADSQLLFALFTANGWSKESSSSLVARIEDWKDADDVPRESGAEMREYRATGRKYGPRNGPFESVDELRQVLGGDDLKPELLDALTVYSHLRSPLESVANAPVLRSLAWADEHRLGGHAWLTSDAAAIVSGPTVGSASLVGEVLRVRACVEGASVRHCRLAIARPTGHFEKPYQVFLWQTQLPTRPNQN